MFGVCIWVTLLGEMVQMATIHIQQCRSHSHMTSVQTLFANKSLILSCQHDWLTDLQPNPNAHSCDSAACKLSTIIAFESLKLKRDVTSSALAEGGSWGNCLAARWAVLNCITV